MSSIINRAGGAIDFYTCAGAVLTSGLTNQPKVDGGAAAQLGANATKLDTVKSVRGTFNNSDIVIGDCLGAAIIGSAVTITGHLAETTVGNSGGYASFRMTAHGLSAGDVLSINDSKSLFNGIYKIVSVPDANHFKVYHKTNTAEVAAVGTLTYNAVTTGKYIARTLAGKYIMMRGGSNSEYLAGASGFTTLRGGNNVGNGRNSAGLNKFKPFVDVATATAIVSGFYNYVTGAFTGGYPVLGTTVCLYTCANVQATELIDDAVNGTTAQPGELTYKLGQFLPVQDEYAATSNR